MTTISQREEWIVASLLDHLSEKWGPNLCTALALTDYWENPVCQRLGKAISQCVTNPTKANVAMKLKPEDALWLLHPTFKGGLPLDLAEFEAFDLCAVYRGRQVKGLIQNAYLDLDQDPENWKNIITGLKSDLNDIKELCECAPDSL